jgi:uncharacterized protein with HEPN domain
MLPESHKMLFDMLQAVARIERFTSGATFEAFQSNDMLRSAVERQFEIIGEALSRLNKSEPPVAAGISEYRKIISFRNVLIHGYDAITDSITWDIIQNKLPILRQELEDLARNISPP